MALLDESMLAAMAGRVSPVITGLVYCGVIASCQRIYAIERAREWTAALSDWCEGQDGLIRFRGPCLVHRAELLQIAGSWPEALDEALPEALPEGWADALGVDPGGAGVADAVEELSAASEAAISAATRRWIVA